LLHEVSKHRLLEDGQDSAREINNRFTWRRQTMVHVRCTVVRVKRRLGEDHDGLHRVYVEAVCIRWFVNDRYTVTIVLSPPPVVSAYIYISVIYIAGSVVALYINPMLDPVSIGPSMKGDLKPIECMQHRSRWASKVAAYSVSRRQELNKQHRRTASVLAPKNHGAYSTAWGSIFTE
jgi:hypothetical protein